MLKLSVRALSAAAFMMSVSLGSLLADTTLAQELSFSRQDTLPFGPFAGQRDAAAGDFNGDGKVDMVVAMDGPPALRILLGHGDGTFQEGPTPPIQQGAQHVVVADFNNDGRQDLAVIHFASNAVVTLLGNGDGTFRAAPGISTENVLRAIVAGDFNGDGAQDLAVATSAIVGSSLNIYLGAGDGTFSLAQQVNRIPIALAARDLNGDGLLDLATIEVGSQQNRVFALLGQGDGTFEPVAQTSADIGPAARSLAVGDFNGDGMQDVATADPNNDVISVLIGNGDGTFAAAQTYAPGVSPFDLVQPLDIEVADFNADGHLDLATANRKPADPPIEGSAGILLGRGDGTFEPAREFATTDGTEVLVVADFNRDGRPDIAALSDSDFAEDRMTVLLNTTATAQTEVTIDIKPGSAVNSINPRSNGKIRVAVLTRDGFDATAVDPATVRFGGTGTEAAPVHFALGDVDDDGSTDLVLWFKTRETSIACGATSASLTGRTSGGQPISGSDSIRTVGCGPN